MKWIGLIAGVLLVLACAKEDEGGCCQVEEARCASGPTVTEAYCLEELNGVWSAGTTCNLDTGACE